MNRGTIASVAALAVVLGGCSTRPRSFTPTLAAAPQERDAYEASLASCRERTAGLGGKATAPKVATGTGSAAAGGMTAGSASWGGAAVAGTVAVVALPVLGIVWGISRGDRGRKEKRIRTAMEECLTQDGYVVAGWTRDRPVRGGRPVAAETGMAEGDAVAPMERSSLVSR